MFRCDLSPGTKNILNNKKINHLSESFENFVKKTFAAAGGNPDDADQLKLTYYSIKKKLHESHEEMVEFLSNNLPYLIEQSTISIQVDVKHIGKKNIWRL